MAPRTLICGSLACDTIMVFPDRFARHILPEQTHVLSVSFQIGEMRREWGGCAGNIAYNLQGARRRAGRDGDRRRRRRRVSRAAGDAAASRSDGVRAVAGTFTAQAFIITDLDDNQITAFHPGAMNRSHANHVGDVERHRARHRRARRPRRHARARRAVRRRAGFPSSSIPARGLPLFSGDELPRDDRRRRLSRRQRLRGAAALPSAPALSLHAHRGARRRADRDAGRRRLAHPQRRRARSRYPRSAPTAVVDPTGCGDAYRAGLLYGIAHGLGLAAHRAARVASGPSQDRLARRSESSGRPRSDRRARTHASFGDYLW